MPKGRREEEEDKPKFRVIDRRGEEEDSVSTKPTAPPKEPVKVSPPVEATPPPVEDTPPADAEDKPITEEGKTEMTQEEREKLQEEVEQSLKFKNTVIYILRTLFDQTWIHLGMVPNPISGLTVKNLEEAHKLIDLLELIKDNTTEEFDEQTSKEIERLLADLKMNYMNQL